MTHDHFKAPKLTGLYITHNKWGFGFSIPELWRNTNTNKQITKKQAQSRDQEALNDHKYFIEAELLFHSGNYLIPSRAE